jgi:TetR/AcrR family transcriptional repressor of nem operon
VSDIKTAIMDAAEVRMQRGGFGGFSFREIAADVGIKSSSVHYHFPTKEDLAAGVVRRWRERASAVVEEELRNDPDPVRVWTSAFRRTAFSGNRICPCTVLAAATQDLPEQVAIEVRSFFAMIRDRMVAEGLSPDDASEVVSTITGALVVANALGDAAEYDRATNAMLRQRATTTAPRTTSSPQVHEAA